MFSYISKGQSSQFITLPAGFYQGVITDMQEGTSKKGAPMMTVSIKVAGEQGVTTVLYFLVSIDSTIWKIDQFVKNVTGITHQEGTQIVISPADYVGKNCYVKLGTEEYEGKNGNTYTRNRCEDVISEDDFKLATRFQQSRPTLPTRPADLPKNNHISASAGSMMDDDIPF